MAGHLARADGEDQASIGVPPQAAWIRPKGRLLKWGDISMAYSMHKPEKYRVPSSAIGLNKEIVYKYFK